jgi:hypothetical protein
VPLPTNIDTTYQDGVDASVKLHQQHHDTIHSAANASQDGAANWYWYRPERGTTSYAHVQRDHGSVQAAIADLINANGTADGTIADVGGAFNQATLNNNFRDLSDKLNVVIAALRATGILMP